MKGENNGNTQHLIKVYGLGYTQYTLPLAGVVDADRIDDEAKTSNTYQKTYSHSRYFYDKTKTRVTYEANQ